MLGAVADGTSAAPAARACGSTAKPTRVNRLRFVLAHGGLVSGGGCDLLLVGEKVRPSTRGVVLGSSDGGRHLTVLAAFPKALHLSGIAREREWLWVVGDLRSSGAFVARARGPRGPWRRVAAPAGLVAATAVAVADGTVWIAGQRQTSHGIEALVLAWRGGGAGFRTAARIRPALGRVADIHEIAAAGTAVVVAGTDSINGVVLAHDAYGFYRAQLPRLLTGANGAAVVAGRGYAVGASGTAGRMQGELLSTSSGRRVWHARRLPASANVADIAFVTPKTGYVVASTVRGSDVRVTSNGGRSWRLVQRLPNVFFERLLPGATTYAVGVSGLYRIGAP
jgi:hypothetical protein